MTGITVAEMYRCRWQAGAVIQVDQAAPENQEISRHLPKFRHDPDLDRNLYLSAAGLSQVGQPARSEHVADPAPASTESVRPSRPASTAVRWTAGTFDTTTSSKPAVFMKVYGTAVTQA